MSSCEFCDKDNRQEILRGSEGIYYDAEDKVHYLYIEHFRNESYKIEVKFCSLCGDYLDSRYQQNEDIAEKGTEEMSKEQRKMYLDFYSLIQEAALEYSVMISERMIHWTMTRINQDIVTLYKECDKNDTDLYNKVREVAKEAMMMKGLL